MGGSPQSRAESDDLRRFAGPHQIDGPAPIYFIKTADPAATIDRLHQAVKEHASHILTRKSPNPTDAARPPVPARRKHIDLQTRTAQSGFVPEPLLEEAQYEAILDTVTSWAKSLERTPGTARTLKEEQLGELLLGTLNGYWQGAASGETFNASGKTDILIGHQDRNAFIAECKIWSGPNQRFTGARDDHAGPRPV